MQNIGPESSAQLGSEVWRQQKIGNIHCRSKLIERLVFREATAFFMESTQ